MEGLLTPLGERHIDDKELLETVADLVEYPVPVLATFSTEYLRLPKELLITVMKGHQKYFAVEDKDARITNHFVVVSNTSEENADTVRVGAERVIRARFEDARFYFEEDRKKRLSERVEELKKVTFQESLGSLFEKMERVKSISGYLADRLVPTVKDRLSRASLLAKTDLVTGVVREFPELQGVMGKHYALLDGEEREVAAALEEQYLPAHSGGTLPRTDTGALLSIADKMDNLAAFFSIGLMPTGSEDPFALRRQALGIIAIILDKGYSLPLRGLVEKALGVLRDARDPNETAGRLFQFFSNRLEIVFADLGYAQDLIQSIIPLSTDVEFGEMRERLEAIKKFREADNYNDFLTAIKRVYNIIPKAAVPGLNVELLTDEAEEKLKEGLDSAKAALGGLIHDRRYSGSISLLVSLAGPINNFFDSVLVMDPREEVRLNRLSLLNDVWKTISSFADFSKLSARQEQ